ncbi:MAG TPA: DUF5709 domain-containing protein [Micromonosporaceae bacterium]|nr:DUF5709 domain-containing protein [Micromonosporaceae bacterium]
MRDDNYPDPVSDAEAEGLPDTADDDSTAFDDVESGREADGPSPAMLPADAPLAVDRFGTTPEEARLGEPLDLKLSREIPEPQPLADDVPRPDATDRPEAFDPDALTEEVDRVDTETGPLGDGSYVEPNLDSVVSMYDRPEFETAAGGTVGRLVEPDEGVHEDVDKDAVAYDAGAAGGGASAEELAMHEVREV